MLLSKLMRRFKPEAFGDKVVGQVKANDPAVKDEFTPRLQSYVQEAKSHVSGYVLTPPKVDEAEWLFCLRLAYEDQLQNLLQEWNDQGTSNQNRQKTELAARIAATKALLSEAKGNFDLIVTPPPVGERPARSSNIPAEGGW